MQGTIHTTTEIRWRVRDWWGGTDLPRKGKRSRHIWRGRVGARMGGLHGWGEKRGGTLKLRATEGLHVAESSTSSSEGC